MPHSSPTTPSSGPRQDLALAAACSQRDSRVTPFDAIMLPGERWSARDLMPQMGYSTWRNFLVPVARARQSAQNQGHDVASNFARSRKVSGERGPAQDDFELSRFAAYLVAMNGDPNKPEVAAAQAYFAIQTRAAEVAIEQAAGSMPAEPLSGLEYALALVDAEQRVLEEKARADEGDRFKRAIEGGDGLGLREFHKKYFSSVTETEFMGHLYSKGYLIDQRGKGTLRESGPRSGTYRNGSQHRHPSFKGKQYFYLHADRDRFGVRHENTCVRPGAWELALRDLLAKEGLLANENTAGLFAIEGGRVQGALA